MMDLTADFCDAFRDDLLANMDVARISTDALWYNVGQQRPQKSDRLHFALIGRLDSASKYGVQGDRKRMADRVFRPLNDSDPVHDVFQIGAFTDSAPVPFTDIWNGQCSVLKDLEKREVIDARSYVLNEVPLEIVSSSKSRMTGGEPRSFDDTLLSIWWNKYEKPAEIPAAKVIADRDRSQVTRGVYYEPAVMPLYTNQFFDFQKVKLIQHDIFDEFNHLIAPWDYGAELRTGSDMAFIASFCPVNIRLHPGSMNRSFRKIYEIRGSSGRVLRRGEGKPTDQAAPLVPETYRNKLASANKRLTDFPGFYKNVKN